MSSENATNSAKPRVATAWLDGCSGCHMSFLDIDERLIELADMIELVYSPVMDIKVFPENVDVALVEGSISSHDDLEKIQTIRSRTKVLVSLGDCAVTGNIPALRNPFGVEATMQRVYGNNGDPNPPIPNEVVPPLFRRVRPIHEVVKVDVFVPGCPPSASAIWAVINDLLSGRTTSVTNYTRFGA